MLQEMMLTASYLRVIRNIANPIVLSLDVGVDSISHDAQSRT